MTLGASVSAATAVVLLGAVYHGGVIVGDALDAEAEVAIAEADAQRRFERERLTDLRIDSVSFVPGLTELTISAKNTGGATIDLGDTDILLDGVANALTITSRKVEGQTTEVWAPQTDLEVKGTTGAAPVRVAIIAPTGAGAFWG